MGTFGQYGMLGMPTEFMESMHNLGSTFGETSSSPFPRYQGLGPLASQFDRPPGFGLSSQSVPTFTSSSVVVIRQQMYESNHEMVHMLTQQMGTILRPLIQDSTKSYQQMETQMTRIGDFLRAPRAQIHQNPPPPPRLETPVRQEEMENETVEHEYQEVEQIPRVARRPHVVLVNRNQDPNHVVRKIRQEAATGEQNLEAIVEQIIVQNGISLGL